MMANFCFSECAGCVPFGFAREWRRIAIEQKMSFLGLIVWISTLTWIKGQASSNQVADAYTATTPKDMLNAPGAVTHSSYR